MKRARAGRDEEVVSIVVLAVIVFGIVIGGAVYTQAQLDAAADIAVSPGGPQPQADTEVSQQRDDPASQVRQAGHRVVPSDRIAIR
jgi:hypothetical protein